MRICLVSQEYPPETAHGGIGTQTYLKAHGLAQRGHRVWVVSRSLNAVRHEHDDGAVHVIRIPGLEQRLEIHQEPADWISYSMEAAVEVAALHSRESLDLVDFPEWAGEGFFHLLNRSEWNRVPTVLHLHGPLVMFAHTVGWPDKDSELYRTGTAMEAACVRLADAIFSSSACSADWCARHYGADRERIPVLHTGVDTELFRPLAVPRETRPTILFMGRITGDKGVSLLVEAACSLATAVPGLRLRLLGRGEADYLSDLRKQARAAGFPNLVELVGFVDRRDLPQHLSRAHLFAAPSTYEPGPGLVNLEAMACGLPVVACAGAGAAEVVADGETGLLVPPEDVDALAAAIHRLLVDPSEAKAMGVRARRYVVEQADSRECIRRIEAFYLAAAGLSGMPE